MVNHWYILVNHWYILVNNGESLVYNHWPFQEPIEDGDVPIPYILFRPIINGLCKGISPEHMA